MFQFRHRISRPFVKPTQPKAQRLQTETSCLRGIFSPAKKIGRVPKMLAARPVPFDFRFGTNRSRISGWDLGVGLAARCGCHGIRNQG